MCHGYLRAECNPNLLIQVLTDKTVTDTAHLEAHSKYACLITLIFSTLFPLLYEGHVWKTQLSQKQERETMKTLVT